MYLMGQSATIGMSNALTIDDARRGSVRIHGLVVDAYCGVTSEERSMTQRLTVDVEAIYDATCAIEKDEIMAAVDYEQVCHVIKDVACNEAVALLETLGNCMIDRLFDATVAQAITITLTKKTRILALGNQGSIGATVSGRRSACSANVKFARPSVRQRWTPEPGILPSDRPSTILAEYLPVLPRGRALDLATGKGRNALFLAEVGFEVDGLDRDRDVLAICDRKAKELGLHNLSLQTIDLEQSPTLEKNAYDLIVNTFYLQRNLSPIIVDALKDGGVLIFQTFLLENHYRFNHPRRKAFCLESNELLHLFEALTVVYYHEGVADDGHYLASLIARKP